MDNKIRSKNNEVEKILEMLEVCGNQRMFADIDPRDLGADYDKQTDPEKKEYFVQWLRKEGYTNIAVPKDEYNIYDISAVKGGKQYIFELKLRSCLSTTFNDSIIEIPKYNMLKAFSNTGYEVRIVNLFVDCIHIHNMLSEREYQDHWAQKTNNWDRTKTKKILVSYKNTEETKFQYK